MIVLSTYTGIVAASLHLFAAVPVSSVGSASAEGPTVSEGPATLTPRLQSNDTTEEFKLRRGRKILISGGIVGGLGFLTMAAGFGVLGGIHLGNPGSRGTLEFEDLEQGRRVLRTAHTMTLIGAAGATMSITGLVLGAVGGTILWRGRRARLSGVLGPGSAGLSLQF